MMWFLRKNLMLILMTSLVSFNLYAQGTSFLGSLILSDKSCDNIGVDFNTDAFQKTQSKTIQSNPSVCFVDRKSQGSKDFDDVKAGFESDVKVCECLAKKEKLENPESDFSLKSTQALVAIQNAKTKALRNDLVFQASIIAPQVQAIYVRSTDNTLDTGNKISYEVQDSRNKNISDALSKSGVSTVKIHDFLSVIDKKQKNPEFDEKLFSEQPKVAGQCIGAREYLAFNTLPKSDDFYSSLSSMDEDKFNENDWNTTELVAQIKLERNKAKREEIKAKLRFLSRNPLIRNLFALDKNKIAESGVSEKRKDEVRNNPAWSSLPKLKKDLFKIIKTLSPDSGCAQSSGRGCIEKITKSQKISDYRKKLGVFFGANSNPHMADLLVWENENSLIDAMKNPFYLKNNESKWMNLPRSQADLNQFLQASENTSTRQCYYFNIVPDNVNVRSEALKKCLDVFSKYCPFVQAAQTQHNSSDDKDAQSELEESQENYAWVTDLEADMDKNIKMKEFNDAICNTPRKLDPSKKPEGIKLDATMSFNDFKNAYCKNKCPDNSSLLPTYLDMFPELAQADSIDVETEAEVKAFSAYIKDNSAVKPIEKDEFTRMANEKVSTSDRVSSVSKSSERLKKLNEFADVIAGMTNGVNPNPPSETSFFDNLKNILPSFSNPENNENSASGYNNSYQASNSTTTASTESKVSDISNKISDETDEKNDLKEKLSDTQEQLRNAKTKSEKQELENRMAMLEQRLKDKDEAIAKYQKLLDNLKNNSMAENSYEGTSNQRKRNPASEAEDSAQVANHKGQVANNSQSNLNPSSNVASVKNDMSSMNSNKFAPSSFVSNSANQVEKSRGSNLNDVLLAKYGIVLEGKDNAQVILAKDKEQKDLMKLEVANKTGQNLELKNVSADIYNGFELKNDETLKNYVKMVESMPAQVVKVSVSTPGRSQVLQFYAIKEAGKVVFQPIRTASLKNLKNELQDNR